MKKFKRLLAFLLVFTMIFGNVSANVAAEENNEIVTEDVSEVEEVTENEKIETVAEETKANEEVVEEITEVENQETVTEETKEDEEVVEETTEDENDETVVEETKEDEEVVEKTTEEPKEETVVEDDEETEDTLMSYTLTKAVSKEQVASYTVEAAKNPRDTSEDGFYKIVHLDAARKYFTPSQIKGYIDEMAEAGMNQLQIYFSDNQGFRLALDDMNVITASGKKYDLTPALGKGYEQTDKGMYPHDTDSYLTQSEMTEIIAYAKTRGIEIVPCLNSPGHLGAILEVFPDFCYSNSDGTTKSSIDLTDSEAVAFALAVVEKYVKYFQSQGCRFFNLGGDEYANDVSGMGFSGLVSAGLYDEFVAYLNNAAQIVINYGMTPRMFNDGAYYKSFTADEYQLNDAIQICYWSQDSGCATAATIAAQKHEMINTSKNLYYVVAKSPWICVTESSAANFVRTYFSDGTTINDPAGAMMCVWCDDARDETMTSDTILSNTAAIAKVYGNTLPSTYNTVSSANVSVAANNLTGVTAVATTAPTVECAAAGKVTAYSITPSTSWGEYKGEATVTVPISDEWNADKVRGFVVNSDETITERIEGTVNESTTGNTFTFEVPHFSTVGAYELDDSAPVNGGSYTVSLGGIVNIPLDSTGDVRVEDATYATAGSIESGNTAVYAKIDSITSGKKYIIATGTYVVTANPSRGSNGSWSNADGFKMVRATVSAGTITGGAEVEDNAWKITAADTEGYYYIQDAKGNYLNISGTDSATLSATNKQALAIANNGSGFEISTSASTSSGVCLNNFGGSNVFASAYSCENYSSNETWMLYEQQDKYQLPVTGVAVGTTIVWVGNTYYTINVVEEDLTNVANQTIHLRLSTYPVYPFGGSASNTSVSVTAVNAYGETGIAAESLAPEQGNWEWASDDVPTLYWKTTRLEDGEHQTTTTAVNQCMNGDDFTHIRYYGGNWQILLTSTNAWTNVNSTDELVAYYLQQTQTTEEVTTYVQDWAFTPAENEISNRYQKALSFAVVYPNGQMSPTESSIYSDSTLLYWDNLANLGFIRIGTNEVYEVSKLTYTLGARTDSRATGCWTIKDSITWNKTTLEDGTEYYDETTVWTEDMGTEPVVNGAELESKISCGTGSSRADDGAVTNYDGTWGANDAVLILIYLKPVVTEDSLTVQYWDDSTNSEIYQYPINVDEVTDENPASFINRLIQTSLVVAGDITLDNEAYVVNAKDVQETFEKDLTQISDLKGKYSSGLYDYVKAEISEDGKTLILHYNLNSTKLQPYYIADFGLSVNIPFDDLGNGVESVTASVPSSANGNVSVDSTKKVITFTPNKDYSGVTVLSVTATFAKTDIKDEETAMYNVGIYPATTVYYEETFAALNGFTQGGTSLNNLQQSVAHGNGSDHSVAYNFGYDVVYADDSVDASNGTQATSSTAGDTAIFEFTGQGIDIYTNNTTETGNLMAKLYAVDSNGTATLKKSFIVQTAMKKGTTSSTGGQNVMAYNVPVISTHDLAYGKYKVVIQNLKKSASEGAGLIQLDGFRVYGSLDYNSVVYQEDKEANPTFIELRDQVLAAVGVQTNSDKTEYADQIAANALSQVYSTAGATSGAVIIDTSGNTTMDAQDLLDNGPKNELYLCPNQSVVFKWKTNVTRAQVGLKSLDKTVNYEILYADTTSVKANLETSTDMFYELDTTKGTITITNNSGGILSITELKAFVDEEIGEAGLAELTEDDLMPALLSLGFEEESIEPEETYADASLNITVADAEGNALATTALSSNGIVGETATFTAADIQTAVEALELPEGYELEEVTYTDVEVAYGESGEVSFTAEIAEAEEPTPEPEPAPEETPDTTETVINKVINTIKNIFSKLFGW